MHANFVIVEAESSDAMLMLRDLGPWDRHRTVTNDAGWVIGLLYRLGLLEDASGRPREVMYYDSEGAFAELRHDGRGHFTGFAAWSPREGER